MTRGLLAAVIRGPASIVRLRARGAIWFAVYLGAAALLLGLVARELAVHRDDLIGAMASYLLPSSWTWAGERLIDYFVRSQLRDVLVNAVIGLSLVVVQIFLFPVKEKLSATFEKEARLTMTEPRDLPLWLQAVEELQLFFLFLTAQMCIFWIGYPPEPWRKQLAVVLSYLYLFGSFGVDFLSPILQRHTLRYSTMFKVFARHPLTVLAFGALFTMPVVLVGRAIAAHPSWTFGFSVALMFGVNVVCIAWAAVAGTYVGAELLPEARRTVAPSAATRTVVFLAFAALFAWNAWRFGAVGLSLHHKSQILKCEYAVDWTSWRLSTPGWRELAAAAVSDGKVKVAASVELSITNPTTYDVRLERNHVDVAHDGVVVARASLTPVSVDEGRTVTQRMELPLELTVDAVRKGRALFEKDRWTVTVFLEVAEGFEFPIYVVTK